MARPIKETPILKGSDAKAFIEKMNNNIGNTVSQEERDRIRKNFIRMQAIVKFK